MQDSKACSSNMRGLQTVACLHSYCPDFFAWLKIVAMREYLIEAQIEAVSASGASSRRSRKGKRGHGPDSRAAMSSSGKAHVP